MLSLVTLHKANLFFSLRSPDFWMVFLMLSQLVFILPLSTMSTPPSQKVDKGYSLDFAVISAWVSLLALRSYYALE